MRAIDARLLRALAQGGCPELIAAVAPLLPGALASAAIDTALRCAHFLAQAVYETGYLTRLAENLDYRPARIAQVWPRLGARARELAGHPERLANAAYAGRCGNGDEASGDGWRYRGRGLLALTGRANYELCAPREAQQNPDLLAEPDGAVRSATAFWKQRAINEAADRDDGSLVTRLVAGCAEGLSERVLLKHRALRLLADGAPAADCAAA